MVHWVPQKQSLVALSSCEAELNAAVFGIRVGIGVRNMLEEMIEVNVGDPKMGDQVLCSREDRRRTIPITLKQDNMACITTITTEVTSWRSRHYALRAAWVRDVIDMEQVTVKYEKGANIIADALTKILGRVKLQEAQERLRLLTNDSGDDKQGSDERVPEGHQEE